MPSPPTGPVTFLSTDIEGSTRLWEGQPEAMQTALAFHDALMRRAIEAHGGYIFKTAGDAFFAAFAIAHDALAAAVAAQRALHDAALTASQAAYAPYSGFRVGAAVFLDNGKIVTGNNQENAAYPSSLCARKSRAFRGGLRTSWRANKKHLYHLARPSLRTPCAVRRLPADDGRVRNEE